MTMTKEQFEAMSSWERVRALTAIINPVQAVNVCALVNLVARAEIGDADQAFCEEQLSKAFGVQAASAVSTGETP